MSFVNCELSLGAKINELKWDPTSDHENSITRTCFQPPSGNLKCLRAKAWKQFKATLFLWRSLLKSNKFPMLFMASKNSFNIRLGKTFFPLSFE
jgi:hypothetical protein